MTHERSSNRKSKDLIVPAVILSFGLVLSAIVIRNGMLKSESGRYEIPTGPLATHCSLFDSKTGDCYGEVNGELRRYNLRKSNYKNDSDIPANALMPK